MAYRINLMIAGAQKAGTTSLKSYLSQHPDILTHGTEEFPFFVNDNLFQIGFEKYLPKCFFNLKTPCDSKYLLAKSAGVMYSPIAMERLKAHNADIEIIVLLRNPVDRAYSAFIFCKRIGAETFSTFEEALEAEEDRLKTNRKNAGLCAYKDRGIYHRQIENLWNTFGKESVHIFLFEEFKTNAAGICQEIFHIAKIESTFSPDVSIRFNIASATRFQMLPKLMTLLIKTNIGKLFPNKISYYLRDSIYRLNKKRIDPPSIRDDTKNYLSGFFKPHNDRLEVLIERDLSLWK
jgi:hypothetical protein